MVIVKIKHTSIGKHIIYYNYLMITTKITLSMGGKFQLMNGYYGAAHVVKQEEDTRLIENQEALDQSINAYLQLGSK